MVNTILFSPLLPWSILIATGALIGLLLFVAWWRGFRGVALRLLAVACLMGALANPSLQIEERDSLPDIVLVVTDETASQRIGGREAQTQTALARLVAQIEARPDTELRQASLHDAEGDGGSLLIGALSEALSDIPQSRLAGVFVVSDGQAHDTAQLPAVPAPVHLVQSGLVDDWDRRLTLSNAPAFAILGEEIILSLRLDDLGEVPADIGAQAGISISVDGAAPRLFQVPVGEDLSLPLVLPHGGINTLEFITPAIDGELTDRNNRTVLSINGVRDRLRVLLVSGEPHPGERTWRNLLRSDSSVDLVHFTILRPPEKQDGVPVEELSLIAFPTRELFLEKIDEFDLIIFDRYRRRGILPEVYLENVVRYVRDGGAVLVAAGPDFASANSLYFSPLGDIMPAIPTARVIEQGYLPQVSDIGARHPVTEVLEAYAPNVAPEDGAPGWGQWLRQIELRARDSGTVVMTGVDDLPLLTLERIGEGRVALLGSDHAWLWSRGYQGGGPQLELLRRLAHWMMQEPELEEESLRAEPRGQSMTVVRRTLLDSVPDITLTTPEGAEVVVPLTQTAPGRYEAQYLGPDMGLYRLSDGVEETVLALGPSSPREFINPIATAELLAPLLEATHGGVARIEDGSWRLRDVRAGRTASGRGWLGLVPRQAYLTTDVSQQPLLPAWAFLLLAAGVMVGGWLREGRR